ncbi:hypothetical protein FJZ20_00200 [Candidatus Pacearchaeota archaeon]|nr:hypothetical protein [Candidatus Pacearchaeota archaeon]
MELKRKGFPEEAIVSRLREHGVSPKEITDALSQAKIKNAVSPGRDLEEDTMEGMEPSIMISEEAESLPTEGTISDEDLMPPPTPSRFQQYAKRESAPVVKEMPEEYSYSNSQGSAQYPAQTESPYEQYSESPYPAYDEPQYSPQEYASGNYESSGEYDYSYSSAGDIDTIIEVAERVFFEKIKPIQKQLEGLNELKALTQTKVDSISDRLRKIESSIDRLQAEILEKVGSYGGGLDSIKKEMGMMQDSFGKIVTVLSSKAEEKSPEHSSHHPAHHIVRKKSSRKK